MFTHSRDSTYGSYGLFWGLLGTELYYMKTLRIFHFEKILRIIPNCCKFALFPIITSCLTLLSLLWTWDGGVRFKRGILWRAWQEQKETCCMWTELWLLQSLSSHSSPERFHYVALSSFPFFQVVLPLIDQYFKNHRLYFLSAASRPLCSGGHASNKEKEMVTR